MKKSKKHKHKFNERYARILTCSCGQVKSFVHVDSITVTSGKGKGKNCTYVWRSE